jgi:hypothetical protein
MLRRIYCWNLLAWHYYAYETLRKHGNIFFAIYFLFFIFTLLQLTTDLYARAVQGNIPLLNDCNRKFFGYKYGLFLCSN